MSRSSSRRIFDELVEFIDSRVRLPDVDFPDHSSAESHEQIERAAEQTRMHWGLGLGPISNMVRVVERAGAVVAFFQEASTEVDALSITSRRPVIVRNDAKKSPYRQRFDIAHELGHLVLHEGHVTGDRKTESEADRFASAFLLPRSTFLKAFQMRGSRLDWLAIRDLKLKFGVSKAAIIYRAKSLGLITEEQFRGAFITLRNRGESIEEVEDQLAAKEAGEIVIEALKVLKTAHGIGRVKLAAALDVKPPFLQQIIPEPPEDETGARIAPLRLVSSS
jgi:Zn-dependent peptidase ImmA (M78 family)